LLTWNAGTTASLVEDQGFRSFVTMLDPQYDMPSRRTVMRRLPAKYNETKQRMLEVLAQLQYLSLTTNISTSQATDSYLTVAAHFIYLWELKNLVLATVQFNVEHTAEHIASELQKITDHWGIVRKIAVIVTSNASNIWQPSESLAGLTFIALYIPKSCRQRSY